MEGMEGVPKTSIPVSEGYNNKFMAWLKRSQLEDYELILRPLVPELEKITEHKLIETYGLEVVHARRFLRNLPDFLKSIQVSEGYNNKFMAWLKRIQLEDYEVALRPLVPELEKITEYELKNTYGLKVFYARRFLRHLPDFLKSIPVSEEYNNKFMAWLKRSQLDGYELKLRPLGDISNILVLISIDVEQLMAYGLKLVHARRFLRNLPDFLNQPDISREIVKKYLINENNMSIEEINKEMGILTTHDAVIFVINVKKELPKVPILDIIKLSYQYRFQSAALDELINYLKKKQDIQDYIENLENEESEEIFKYGLALYDFDIYMLEYDGTKKKEKEKVDEYWNKFKEENQVESYYPGIHDIYDYFNQLPVRKEWDGKINKTYQMQINELNILKQKLDMFKQASVSNDQYQSVKGGSIKKKRRSSKRKSLKRKSSKRKSLKRKSSKRKSLKRKSSKKKSSRKRR